VGSTLLPSESVTCRKMPPGFRLSWLCLGWLILLMFTLPGRGQGLRCYVCGGNSGVQCHSGTSDHMREEDLDEREGLQGMSMRDPVQECNDLINNRGCVKQYVNGVVLLRGCWLDGTNKCLKNGAAEVCTCSTDLCNSARTYSLTQPALLLLPLLISYLQSLLRTSL